MLRVPTATTPPVRSEIIPPNSGTAPEDGSRVAILVASLVDISLSLSLLAIFAYANSPGRTLLETVPRLSHAIPDSRARLLLTSYLHSCRPLEVKLFGYPVTWGLLANLAGTVTFTWVAAVVKDRWATLGRETGPLA